MRVLVAMSGGVDSSVAAALVRDAGHETVGVTMKLWGGPGDAGCCSVGDVEDARRVAQQLGIDHHVFNFSDDFDRHVVAPFVAEHAAGRTPNPCIECNRHLKFDRLLVRAGLLGFDAIATGHHARIVESGGRHRLRRGADPAKDQSYVLHMLDQHQLCRVLLPVGEMTKAEVRARAAELGLRTAAKPDSQDVCFLGLDGGREAFLGARIPLRPGRLVASDGAVVGSVPALEVLTVGQRRGLGDAPRVKAERRYVLSVDVPGASATVGPLHELMVDEVAVAAWSWTDREVPAGTRVEVQVGAHGRPVAGEVTAAGVRFDVPQRRVAPGQSVVCYAGDSVLGGGPAA